jgi:hypothetical protein
MRLDLRAMAFSAGMLWGGAAFLTGLANLVQPTYGREFLELLASIYPGYDISGSFGDLITGTLYALVDGGICGLVFAWVYNLFAGKTKTRAEDVKREAGVHYPPVEPPGSTS